MKLVRRNLLGVLQLSILVMVLVQPLFGLTIVGVDASTTIYVPGTYSTIQEAIDNAADGDTIIVSSGTYK